MTTPPHTIIRLQIFSTSPQTPNLTPQQSQQGAHFEDGKEAAEVVLK